MYPFQYRCSTDKFVLTPEKAYSHHQKFTLEFPVFSNHNYQNAKPANGYYYLPLNSTEAKPCIILVHGWGDRSAIPMRKLAADLAEHGVATVFLYSPFHSRRAPRPIKKKGTHLTPEEWFVGYQILITDIFSVLDWLAIRSEIDNGRIGLVGLSMGAFIGSIALALEERLKLGVLLLSGGNSGKIAQLSRFRNFRKDFGLPDNIYEQTQRKYLTYLKAVREKGWENVTPDQNSYYIDAMTYAHLLRKKPMLMINALWDEFIPREATLDFWEAAGKPALEWLPATHPTIWAFYPRILKMITGFLVSTFNNR